MFWGECHGRDSDIIPDGLKKADPSMSIQHLRKVMPMVCMLSVAAFAAESPFVGTWKLNAAKSKLAGSSIGPNGTVHIETADNGLKASVDATDPKGQPLKFSYQAPLDGTDGVVTGNPNQDAVSLKRVNDHTLTAVGKKDGKVLWTDRRVVSADGKTMTLTRNGTDPDGKKYHATAVFEKQ